MPQLAPFLASRFSPLAHPPAALSYNPALSLWLSVDPLSDKYPNTSPYAYCGGNPVVLKDPDGRDVIEVDQKTGRTTITRQEGNDILRCGRKTTELSGNGVYRQALEAGNKEGSNGGILLAGMSKSDARKTFNFMADNTNVEWGFMETRNDDGSSNFMVGSSHSDATESVVFNKAMDAKAGSVLRYDHSHFITDKPGTLDWAPSTPVTATNGHYVDTDAWNDLMQKNPNVTLGIRYGRQTRIFVDKGCVNDTYPIKKYMK